MNYGGGGTCGGGDVMMRTMSPFVREIQMMFCLCHRVNILLVASSTSSEL